MPRVYFKTLGCKVNTYDTNALVNQFRQGGFAIVDDVADADVAVVNTCSVTENADKEARYLARRLKRENPHSLLVATGCYAQTDSAKLSALDEIDLVIPNEAKHDLVQHVQDRLANKTAAKLPVGVHSVSENRQSHFKSSVTLFDEAHSEQTRAFVKIQDGCNGFCTYCLIPYARGASRSVEADRALGEIERLIAAGTKEIVITGIHVGDYGHDLEGPVQNFATFLERVFALPGLQRLRISSLEPSEVSPAVVDVLRKNADRTCDHFHLPLQAGNDRILKAMRRTYTTAEYADAVRRLREVFPAASIGADVIPGFPGETAEEFAETSAYIRQLELSYLHVFPYSKRPNTAAARMPNHLPVEVVKARSASLRALSKELQKAYTAKFLGHDVEVLWEEKTNESGQRYGLTKNYLRVMSAETHFQAGQLSSAHLHGFKDGMTILGSQA